MNRVIENIKNNTSLVVIAAIMAIEAMSIIATKKSLFFWRHPFYKGSEVFLGIGITILALLSLLAAMFSSR